MRTLQGFLLKSTMIAGMTLFMTFRPTNAFQATSARSASVTFTKHPTLASKSSSHHLKHQMTLSDVSELYAQYPLQSAVVTCGVKASLADGIAQVNAKLNHIELRRNFAYLMYGGIFIGLACHLEYDYVFPLLFDAQENGLFKIVEEVVFDNFVSAPFFWLPPAYLTKAVVYDYSFKEGLEKYWHDITENQLLIKYWKIWVPAQTISFSVIPDHLRVPFMASISFFWFILFSTISTKDDDQQTKVKDEELSSIPSPMLQQQEQRSSSS